ncbi:hypothetical protein DFJ74DRAFT_702701 [Hyaloraphidium curvatum]|nr:hypothetical protein DFJ74DRAFT_702701 [Hyaloraphidium curvatum]
MAPLISFPSSPDGLSDRLLGEYYVLFSTNPFYRKRREVRIVYEEAQLDPKTKLLTMKETMLYKGLNASDTAGFSRALGLDVQLQPDDGRFHWRMTGPFPLGLLYLNNTTSIIGHGPDFEWIALHVGSTMLNSECVQIFARKPHMDEDLFRKLRAELEDLELVKQKRATNSWGSWLALWQDGNEGERYKNLVSEGLVEVVKRG